jgi:hypothetical protein
MRAMNTARVLAFSWPLVVWACATGGGSDPKPDAAIDASNQPVCGDGVCVASEQSTCTADCPKKAVCPDGTCNGQETSETCPADCPATVACGNNTCDTNENEFTCAGDCPTGAPLPDCPACVYDASCDAFSFGTCYGYYFAEGINICDLDGVCESDLTQFPPPAGKPENPFICDDCL